MAEYRILDPSERAPVDLWSAVFEVEAPFFTTLLDAGETGEDVSLAALDEGEIVSSVHVFARWIRDRAGRPLKVGGVGSVSTRPDHRGRGHSGRLLRMAIDAMDRRDCVWSLLGTGVNDHYARYGWRTVSMVRRVGDLREGPPGRATILAPDEANLDAMARLYDASSQARPMATVRTRRAWRTAIRYRLRSEQATIFGAFDDEGLVAYLVLRDSWDGWAVSEVAGDEDRFTDLLAAAGAHLRGRGGIEIGSRLSEPGNLRCGWSSRVENDRLVENRSWMVRPISDRIGWSDLFALVGDPRGEPSDLDDF